MRAADALSSPGQVFLDTAPVIYFIEKHGQFGPIAAAVFELLDRGLLNAVTSPVTLAECLIGPIRVGRSDLVQTYARAIVSGPGVRFIPLDRSIAGQAAEIRARQNVTLTDAIQIATAVAAKCDGFLTNDSRLRRVPDIPVYVLEDFEG